MRRCLTAAEEKKKNHQNFDGLTAKRCPPQVPLPGPLSGWMPECLPLSLHWPLPVRILLLHWDVKLVVNARVLLVENDLESKGHYGRTERI